MTLRGIAGLAMAIVLACARERPADTAPRPDSARVDGSSYAPGTVGDAINGYWLDMNGVRRWYAVLDSLNRFAARDTTFGVSLNFPFRDPVAPHIARIDSVPALHSALAAQLMSPREFIALTASIAGAQLMRQMADSIGPTFTPEPGIAAVMSFLESHRAAIDSIEAQLHSARPPNEEL